MQRMPASPSQLRGESFGRLLRAFRMSAGLTQEALAERAGLSRRGIADLERGARLSPHQHTIDKRAESLGLERQAYAALAAASRRRGWGAAHGPVAASLAEPPTSLVGRAHELAELQGHLVRAGGGRRQLVLVGGEAGIGKTALVSAFARDAARRGAYVLAGHAYDVTETPPYGPWLELVRDWPPDAAPLPLAGGSTTSFDAVQAALTALSTERVVVLVLEDLQWADPASLELFRSVTRHARLSQLLVIGTFRDSNIGRDHQLRVLLPIAGARSRRVATRSPAARARGGCRPGPRRYRLPAPEAARLVEYLQGRAEGNPFYIRELLRTLEEVGSIRRTDSGWTIDELASVQVPPLVRQLVEQRLARIGPAVRELLSVGAVIRQDVPLEVLAKVAGHTQDSLLEMVEHAVDAGIVVESADGQNVRFTHAIFRSTLYESLLAARRRAWHARAAEVLLA